MAEMELKLLIEFRKAEDDINFVKREAKNFFEHYVKDEDLSCNININPEKNIDVDLIYKADLHEIEVVLDYKNCGSSFSINDQFKKIGKNWCNTNVNKISHLWLRLANRSILENKGKQFHTDVDVKEIAFGTSPYMKHFMQHYHYETISLEKELSGTFFHNQRYFLVYMCLVHVKQCRLPQQTDRFKIFYKSIARVIMDDDQNNNNIFNLYFVMRHIPLVFKEKKGTKDDDEEMRSGNRAPFLASDQEYQERKWQRTTTFGCRCNASFCCIDKIGRCPVLKVVIPKTRASGIFERLIQRCSPSTYFYFSRLNKLVPKQVKLENFEIFPDNEEYFRSISDKNLVSDIKFACQYAWEVVLGRSLEIKDQIILKSLTSDGPVIMNCWDFIKNEMRRYIKHKDALVNTLYHISDMINRHDIFVFEEALQKLFDHYRKNPVKTDLPEGMCLVRRLIIMPSRVICLQPMEHFDNRVIREFGSENILRVSIQDDDFSRLTFAIQYHTHKEEFLFKVKKMLNKGISIGPRKYRVLAASNSQLREHGLYMFAADHKGNTADKIREWMGDFSHIRNVAKYMARLGQCFSTSEEAVQIKLEDEDVISLDDIKNDDYVFSDGCGMISTQLADEIRKAFKEKVPLKICDELPTYNPSAYQIRFQGCKGMVAENPTLSGRKFGKRPSMEKFTCDSSSVLEIVKISAPRALFLNRPLISLLEQLGISPNIFMKLQKEMVMDMTDSLIYERKAHKMLANRTGLDFPYKKLLKSGICLSEEPFFRRLLLSVYTILIDQLRSKARIAIPPQYGRNMLGVIDETYSLEYGEVFVQYSEEVGNDFSPTHILEGIVVVTKNPCMHPGDVRKLKARNVKELHHIKDCIVFPAKGPRPHPDEMAGSDLDGDEFVVIWLPDLIFTQHNYPAMNYPANEETKHSGFIMVSDMIDFLCKYIQNDNVGLMANAYLAWADNHPDGIFSKVCSSIALKYPRALDFAKSGTTEYLTSSEKPKIYPDFMEKGCMNNSYKSQRTLGLLYRVIRTLDACVSKVDLSNQEIVIDENLIYPGWKHYKESAECYRHEYVKRVKNILKKYGLSNETEVLSGYIGKMNEFCENRYERDNALSVARTYLKDTIKRYRYEFYKSFDSECVSNHTPRSEISEIKYRRASAWYVVTYKNQDKSILSFPWVISEVLCEMREKVMRSKKSSVVPKSSLIEMSDLKLLSTFSEMLHSKPDACKCCLILGEVVAFWMTKCSLILTMKANERFCIYCFERILNKFRDSSDRQRQVQRLCCSINKNGCDCKNSCSPTKLVLEFFKFYASEVVPQIRDCSHKNCEGFRELNLQSLALQSYATLAVTRNINYLISEENVVESNWGGDYEEGDPIRVPVPKNFEDVITHHMEELSDLLKMLSGVSNIFINGDRDKQNNWFIFVHSIGKPHQRWSLEELIMDSGITKLVKSKLRLSL